MIRLLFRHAARFAKITPEIYPKMRAQLEESLSLKSLGEYFAPENREELLELVMKSKLTPTQSNSALESLLELCGTDSDQELNLIVNVLKQRAINHTRTGNLADSVGDFEQAIATVLLMEHPDELVLSQLYKFIGDLYIQMGDLKKAEKSLKDA
jgi:tetratricopeptide (TPR) repeat protein